MWFSKFNLKNQELPRANNTSTCSKWRHGVLYVGLSFEFVARKSGISMPGKDHLLPNDFFIDSYMPIGYGFIFPGKSTRTIHREGYLWYIKVTKETSPSYLSWDGNVRGERLEFMILSLFVFKTSFWRPMPSLFIPTQTLRDLHEPVWTDQAFATKSCLWDLETVTETA